MAEPVIVPVRLEVTDVDTTGINFADASKEISKSLSGLKKQIQDVFSGIDASAINKPIESAMNNVKKSVQAAEDAQLRYNEALAQAGKSSASYKSKVKSIKGEIEDSTNHIAYLERFLQTNAARKNPGVSNTAAKELEAERQNLARLQKKLNKLDPTEYISDAAPIQLEKVANAYKKVLSSLEDVNKKSEDFNKTVRDNRLTDEYQEYIKQANDYRKKLEELGEKSKRMKALGATDKQWEALKYDTAQVSSEFDSLLRKMRDAVKTGEAFRFGDASDNELLTKALNFQNKSFNASRAAHKRNIVTTAESNQSPYTDEYQKALDELDKLEKQMEKIREKSAKMFELGASKNQFEGLAYDAEKLDIQIDEVKNHLFGMVNTGKAFKFGNGNAEAEISKVRDKSNSLQSILGGVATNAKKAQGGLTALGATNPKLAAILSTVSKIAVGFGKVLKVAGKVAITVGKGFVGVAKVVGKVASGIASAIKNLRIFGKSGSRTSTDLGSKFKKLNKNILMWGFGFRTAYYAIKRLRNIFVESFKVMGDQFDEVGQPMMRLMEAFNQLKGSLATAFQPLVSVVMPILTRFISYLTTALNAVGTFMATLTGQGHIYKAVAKNIDSVSDSAKEAKNALGSYDKLEVIQDNGGDDNSAGYSYEMQKIDATSAASSFAEMVKEAWENADFTGVGQFVTEKLLGILTTVEQVIVPKVTEFINHLLTSVNTFFDGFDSTAIGTKLGSVINTIVEGLDWTQIGLFFANLYNELWQFFDGLIQGIDWELLGQSLNTGLTTLVDNLDFVSLASAIAGLTTGIIEVIEQIDWSHLATTLLAGFQTVLQTLGDALANSDNPLVSGIGNVILALNDAITILTPVVGALLGAIGPIVNSVLPIIAQLLPPIAELISSVVNMVLPVLISLMEAIMPIVGEVIDILLPILFDLLGSLQPIFDALTNVVLPVIVHLLDACMPLIEGLLGLVTDLLSPIVALLGPLLEIVFKIIDPLITILEPLMDILGTLCGLVGDILRPILDALLPILELVSSVFGLLSPIIELAITPLQRVADLFKFVAGIIEGTVVPILDILMGVVELVMKALKLFVDTIGNAFKGLKGVLDDCWANMKRILNSILAAVEKVANGIIKAINSVIAALNNLSFEIPDWVPGLGGKTFGFNLKPLNQISIPRLAQGAVIPPNREFLAMLGDQKHGTNIEAPLDTIKQAVAEVLAELGGAGSKQPIVLQVNGRTLAQVVWDEQEKRYKQTGKAMA